MEQKTINDKVNICCGKSFTGFFISLNMYRVAGNKPNGSPVVCSYDTRYSDIADAFNEQELEMMLNYKRRKTTKE